MADKDVDQMMRYLVPLAKHFVTVTASNPRALSAQELAKRLEQPGLGVQVTAAASIAEGVTLARELAGQSPVCALGTLYFSADVRRAVEERL
jgi:dihydrofolate synthase/folylpolyglutamate synthase